MVTSMILDYCDSSVGIYRYNAAMAWWYCIVWGAYCMRGVYSLPSGQQPCTVKEGAIRFFQRKWLNCRANHSGWLMENMRCHPLTTGQQPTRSTSPIWEIHTWETSSIGPMYNYKIAHWVWYPWMLFSTWQKSLKGSVKSMEVTYAEKKDWALNKF